MRRIVYSLEPSGVAAQRLRGALLAALHAVHAVDLVVSQIAEIATGTGVAQGRTVLAEDWVLPHPERHGGALAPMRRDDEIERIAVEFATKSLEAEGYNVESVESENRGFDLIARKPQKDDPKTFAQVRFVEVKGRAFTGEVALTYNEYKTAERLKQDFWLYVVFHCASSQPSLNILRDPARLHWQPIVKIEHYRLAQEDQRNPRVEEEQAPYGDQPAKS